MKTRMRQGRLNWLSILLLLALLAGGVGAWTFGPFWLDHLNMKEVSASAALSWYSSSTQRAGIERLRQGIENKGIDYISVDDCQFSQQGEILQVYCYWEVNAFYPFTGYYKTLSYELTTQVNGRGVVEQF